MLNKIARLVGAFFITLVVLLLMLFIVLTAMEYRPESTEKVRIDSLAEDTFDSPEVGSTIKVMSWNIGYGALGDNADFFMDGGSQVTTASAERVHENLRGIIDELKSEKADVMFNSALVYELSVLKLYAEPLLFQIEEGEPEYQEAKRLLKFLDYFVGVPIEDIPKNSILREFVGGSCFDV